MHMQPQTSIRSHRGAGSGHRISYARQLSGQPPLTLRQSHIVTNINPIPLIDAATRPAPFLAVPPMHRGPAPAAAGSSSAPPPPTPDPAKPPYALLSSAVYSLATTNAAGNARTLNLVTYASPVSIVPRFYALGLYKGTLSAANMLETGEGVLQILSSHHAPLFELLGRTSGRDVDKLAALAEKGVPLREWGGQTVIGDAVGAVRLRIASAPTPAGDHDVVLCSVEEFETFNGNAEPLYTGQLRREGYM